MWSVVVTRVEWPTTDVVSIVRRDTHDIRIDGVGVTSRKDDRHRQGVSMQTTPLPPRRTNIPAIVVGATILVAAILGLFYNAASAAGAFMGVFDPLIQTQKLTWFYHAFFVMSGICVFCYAVLFACGIDLVRSHLRSTLIVTMIFALEVVYFFSIGPLWLHPTLGHSIGAATGVANGGLMIQFMIALPLWAPIVLWWAKLREETATVAGQVPAA
jgi:hypothetical protein